MTRSRYNLSLSTRLIKYCKNRGREREEERERKRGVREEEREWEGKRGSERNACCWFDAINRQQTTLSLLERIKMASGWQVWADPGSLGRLGLAAGGGSRVFFLFLKSPFLSFVLFTVVTFGLLSNLVISVFWPNSHDFDRKWSLPTAGGWSYKRKTSFVRDNSESV